MNTPSQNPQSKNKFVYWLKNSITARMLMVGFLTIILIIPLAFVQSLITERSIRQNGVVAEINSKWGNDVLLYGPILKVPYKYYTEIKTLDEKTNTYIKEIKTTIKCAYIFPDSLDAQCDVDSKELKRGNFESAVYTSTMNISGKFTAVDLTSKTINSQDILWDKISILVRTSNLKGIKEEVNFNVDNHAYPFQTNFVDSRNYLDELESNFLNLTHVPKEKDISFSFSIVYNGSKLIRIIPIGKTTSMHMTSNWPDPSFTGSFLPNDETKEITQNGFKADWKVLHINRPFSQYFLKTVPDLNDYAFGTKFVVMVDEYQKSERSAKYGFLVIGLTFLIFFLIQTLSKIPIHAFQYLMIGLALTMFYTLLVSISEHSNFLKAYLIAGSSVVLLITLYSKSILKTWKFPVFIAVSLSALYSFIYVIIQLENYALLVGSIGLFLILAAVMFVSRKIDWNNG